MRRFLVDGYVLLLLLLLLLFDCFWLTPSALIIKQCSRSLDEGAKLDGARVLWVQFLQVFSM